MGLYLIIPHLLMTSLSLGRLPPLPAPRLISVAVCVSLSFSTDKLISVFFVCFLLKCSINTVYHMSTAIAHVCNTFLVEQQRYRQSLSLGILVYV